MSSRLLATQPSMMRSMAPPSPRRTLATGTATRTSPMAYNGMHNSTVCTDMKAIETMPRSVSMSESLAQAPSERHGWLTRTA